jgi:hypothetical protein
MSFLSERGQILGSLPHTESMRPKPVYARYLRRKHHMPLGEPSEEERSDAIRILRDDWLWADEITTEAFRILDESPENFSEE